MAKYANNIPPRPLKFLPFKAPKPLWHQSDIETYHFNALAIFLPILEHLVVLSIKKAIKEISDPKLKSEVASLVSQEAIHGREFQRYNKSLIYPHYSIRTEQYQLRFFRVFAGTVNKISSSFHYALSAAGEHFTAIAAELFLRENRWFKGAPTQLSSIWRWHCIEEIEHRSVAYDVFSYFNGSYIIRVLAMLVMTIVFASLYLKPIWQMMKQDKKCTNWTFYKRAFCYYWGKHGLCIALFKPYLRFFRPSFHPSQQHSEDLIRDWKRLLSSCSPEEAITALEQIAP